MTRPLHAELVAAVLDECPQTIEQIAERTGLRHNAVRIALKRLRRLRAVAALPGGAEWVLSPDALRIRRGERVGTTRPTDPAVLQRIVDLVGEIPTSTAAIAAAAGLDPVDVREALRHLEGVAIVVRTCAPLTRDEERRIDANDARVGREHRRRHVVELRILGTNVVDIAREVGMSVTQVNRDVTAKPYDGPYLAAEHDHWHLAPAAARARRHS
jgi:predicted transcriptional regulator